MNKQSFILLSIIFLSGCSTIERRDYYTPEIDSTNTDGPERPSCGFANFGGLPDTYLVTTSGNTIKVTAEQNFHPYFWGPWFAAVVPVFPITWITELFVDDDLEITVYIDREQTKSQDMFIFSVSSKNNSNELAPSEISVYKGDGYTYHHIKFPIEYDKTSEFVLTIKSNIENIEDLKIPFKETSRWSWSQWSPNC